MKTREDKARVSILESPGPPRVEYRLVWGVPTRERATILRGEEFCKMGDLKAVGWLRVELQEWLDEIMRASPGASLRFDTSAPDGAMPAWIDVEWVKYEEKRRGAP